jgi:hypothetical protein
MLTASLAPFEKAASRFDSAIVAARDVIIAGNYDFEGDPKCVLLQINGTLRLLKTEARVAISLLATSDLAEHRARAEMCRGRMADAINLQRAASRHIRQGAVPPLPASYAGSPAAKAAPPCADPWAYGQVWLMAWAMAWCMTWSPRKG